jgi:hypothetical protein
MNDMDWGDLALLAAAAYLAVVALVRLMIQRRNYVIDQLQSQVRQARQRRKKIATRERAETRRDEAA